MAGPTPWTDERIAELQRLWAEGYSAGEIAVELRFGTRSAVLGKLARLGLQRRKPERASKPLRAKSIVRRPVFIASKPEPLPPPPPPAEGVTFMQLTERSCRWPLGEGKPEWMYQRAVFFCGAARGRGFPYCPHHMRIAFVPMAGRRR